MRIVYIYMYFVAREGHGMTRAYEFARRLIDHGHAVTVVSSPSFLPEPYASITTVCHVEIEGVPVVLLPVRYQQAMSFPRRMIAFAQFALATARVVARTPADVIYASSSPLTVALPAWVGALAQRIPYVFEVRDLWPELPIAVGALKNPLMIGLARVLEWLAYHGAAHVVALSPGMAAGVQRRGVPAHRVSVIPNASDTDLFDVPADVGAPIRARLGLAPHQPLIVYTGTFGLVNYVAYLVQVAEVLRDTAPDVHMLLVGRGVEYDMVHALAAQKGLLNHTVTMWPPLPKKDIPALLAAASVATVTVQPLRAMWNNSANKFFDALAAGKPVAINYGGWQADLLAATGAGIRMADDDPVQGAHDLLTLLRNPARLAAAGEAARQLAYTRFQRDTLAAQLEAVLQHVVHAGRGGTSISTR